MPREETPEQMEERWVKYAKKLLIGRTITDVRYLSHQECNDLGWDRRPVVIQLDDDTLIYPSRDDEGNNGGSMFVDKIQRENQSVFRFCLDKTVRCDRRR